MAKPHMLLCTEKLWLTRDGKTLVKHGSQSAGTLFCVPGKKLSAGELTRIDNASEFFAVPGSTEAPAQEQEQEPIRRGPGRPRKE